MANYSIPYQSLNYNIPDEGKVYLDTSNRDQPQVAVVKGQQIYYMPVASYSGDTSKLDSLDPESGQNFARLFGQAQHTNDASLFSGQASPSSDYTQNIDPNNPNGIIVSRNGGSVVSKPNAPGQPGVMNPGTSGVFKNVNTPDPTTGSYKPPAPDQTPVNPNTPGQAPQPGQPGQVPGQQPVQPGSQGQPQGQVQPGGQPDWNKSPLETTAQYNARIAAYNPAMLAGSGTGAAGSIDSNYKVQPGETMDAYNARIAAYNASKPTTTPTGTLGGSGSMAQSGGNSGTDPYAGLDPVQKQVKMYTEAYNALGLATIKQQFDEFAKQQSDLTNELAEKKIDVQSNPWLAQGIVDKEQAKLDAKYAVKLDTLTHLLTLTDSLYKQGTAQVDHMVSDANADIKATNDLAQKQIDAATAIAKDNQIVSIAGHEWLVNKESGAKVADLGRSTTGSSANTTSDITNYNYAKSQGYSGSFQQFLADKTNTFGNLFGNDTSSSSSQYAPSLYDQVGSSIDWNALGL